MRTPDTELTVRRGDPEPEELAVLVAAVRLRQARAIAAGSARDTASASRPARSPVTGYRSGWADRSALLRMAPLQDASPRTGPDAWRRSALPR